MAYQPFQSEEAPSSVQLDSIQLHVDLHELSCQVKKLRKVMAASTQLQYEQLRQTSPFAFGTAPVDALLHTPRRKRKSGDIW